MTENKFRVLLIEDDRLDQLAFERFVEQCHLPYDYEIARSILEAGNKIDTDNFDVIVADYNLGDGNIFDVIDLIKKIPTIITTGAGGEDIAVKAMRAGVFDYLIKDIDHNYLKILPVVIEKAISHKKMDDQIKLLSHAMMNIFDCVYITDMQDKIIFVNKSFCKTYGFVEKYAMGKTIALFQKSQDKTKLKKNVNPVIYKDFCYEFWHLNKKGKKIPVTISKSFITHENGKRIAKVNIARDISERKRFEEGIKKLVNELQEALANVKTLSGFLPICASCKKIRDDTGYWNQIEQYIKDHSEAEFSHGLCPECARELYPELYESKAVSSFQL